MPKNVKNTTIISPLDLLAPHTCRGCGRIGKALCDCCKKNIINTHQNFCPICKTSNSTGICQKCHNLPPIFTVSKRSSLTGSLIYDFKYNSTRALKSPIAEILHQTLPPLKGNVIIVPLPTSSSHVRSRGFDHTYLIAQKFVKLRGPQYKVQKLLVRNKNTIQVGADRETRFSQAQNAYQLAKNIKIDNTATYLLFDDVWTTGASIFAAIKKLREAGVCNIAVSVLAVSTLDDE